MRSLKTLAAALLAVTATPLAVDQFSSEVPPTIPSVVGWERISGDLEFENPRVAVRYEFYVNPARPAIYEVVRYRVTALGPGGGNRVTEKLQWDRDSRDLRRFECVARSTGAEGCAWQELPKGGHEYLREVPVLLRLYGAHNRRARNGG